MKAPRPPAAPPYPIHPACARVPPMPPGQLDQLRESIRAIGIVEPIVIHEGQVIDGKHRQEIGLELGIAIPTRPWSVGDVQIKAMTGGGFGDQLLEVWIEAMQNRRELTSSQRACWGAEILSQEKAAAKLRMGRKDLPQSVGEGKHAGEAMERAAKRVGSNRDYVRKAAKILEVDSDVFILVRAGKLCLNEAYGRVTEKRRPITEPPAGADQGEQLEQDQGEDSADGAEDVLEENYGDEDEDHDAPDPDEIEDRAPWLLEAVVHGELELAQAAKLLPRLPPCTCGGPRPSAPLTTKDAETIVRQHMRGRQVTIESAIQAVIAAAEGRR